MLDFKKHTKDEGDLIFLNDLRIALEKSQVSVALTCNGYSFQIDPCGGGAEIWHFGTRIEKYDSIEDVFLKFMIDGKPFIERIADIDYDD